MTFPASSDAPVANTERTALALFAPPGESGLPADRRAVRRRRVGWTAVVVAVVSAIVVSALPAPYLVELPGPVFDTLGSAEQEDGTEVPLITVEGTETYPTTGRLDLLTVSVQGNEQRRPNWAQVLGTWFRPSQAVVPVEAVYPPGVTNDQVDRQNALDMQNSQQAAIAAALVHEGVRVPSRVVVSQVADEGPAAGVLEEGDRIVSVDGTSLEADADVDALRSLVAAMGTAADAELVVERDGAQLPLAVRPESLQGSAPVLGVGVSVEYDFPYDVELRLDRVGGPSAGMMFALGIIDKTTPGDLAGGAHVAGTGTITASGTVGGIGGIRQKMYGAQGAGATVFLAPSANCDEVVGHVPDGLDVYAVGTLDQAVDVLETVADGGDTGALATCSAG